MILTVLQWLFYIAFAGSAALLGVDVFKNRDKLGNTSKAQIAKSGFIGLLTNFGDTLGIGSFGPIVALMKILKVDIHDKEIPGTLNVSCTLPVLFEAILFTSAIKVDPVTLAALIAAAVVGSYIGAGIISKMDETKIQLVMGIALFAAAIIMFITHPYLGIFATENNAIQLTGIKLILGIIGNFILGALMTAGVGLYAPCMAMIFLLGMNIKAAFPIMMGSCALLMPVASAKFVKEQTYNRLVSIFISIFGLIGVALAVQVIGRTDVEKLKFIVIAVIIYTAYTMFKAGMKGRKEKIA
ncbi:sulfite exporter TauE/SafE family protein [Peptostreptococcus canis]|uniref:Probable membrane transporter protein n=1 Tax=Peptostreptococcus canis TaxID=1159213 RepID=A0ABR6TKU6_9FIRM|nr:sulfite exporter TauE/SafE family protein [Peptostreptococcus canis]MBC2576037.1 sulfite exporter TauE/SafE family protein [Peptostreptococcus canis]MBP1997838.1 putative membrane protein YfcA [Peptostreptococcus canis]